MKKWKLLPILGMTAATATLGCALVSCNDNKTTQEPEFVIISDYVNVGTTEVEIQLDWEPNDSIEFDNSSFEFTYEGSQKKADVTAISSVGTRPFTLKIDFAKDPITSKGISDGILSFTYDNHTTKTKQKQGKINNIKINVCYVLNTWESDRLKLSGVNFDANKEYKLEVDLTKFEDDFGEHPQLTLQASEYDDVQWCRVFLNDEELTFNEDFVCQSEDGNDNCFLKNISLETTDKLYFLLTFNEKLTNKTLWFKNR